MRDRTGGGVRDLVCPVVVLRGFELFLRSFLELFVGTGDEVVARDCRSSLVVGVGWYFCLRIDRRRPPGWLVLNEASCCLTTLGGDIDWRIADQLPSSFVNVISKVTVTPFGGVTGVPFEGWRSAAWAVRQSMKPLNAVFARSMLISSSVLVVAGLEGGVIGSGLLHDIGAFAVKCRNVCCLLTSGVVLKKRDV